MKTSATAKPRTRQRAAVTEPEAAYAVEARSQRSRSGALSIEINGSALRYEPPKANVFARVVHGASPLQLLETERTGVDAVFLSDMARRMHVSYSYLAETLGISKATAARKLANKDKIDGSAAIALARLLAIAQDMVDDSTSPDAKGFDAAKWLGQWIERPQASLGGRKPAELLDTPTGVSMVIKLLGAIRSGAYQ